MDIVDAKALRVCLYAPLQRADDDNVAVNPIEQEYEYILEMQRDGTIEGGEWVGDSKQEHPAFLWRNMGDPEEKDGPIAVADVRQLLQLSRE